MRQLQTLLSRSVKGKLGCLVRCYRRANVSDSAVVLAYYILLSIFPLLIILGSLLKIAGINYAHLLNSLNLLLPTSLYRYLKPVVYSALRDGGKSQLSIGLVLTIWSASRMIAAFQRTVNAAYGAHRPGAIVNRLISFLWMIVFILLIVGVMFFSVFGKMLLNVGIQYLHRPPAILELVDRFRFPATVAAFYGILCALYYCVPIVKIRMRYVWLGALVATGGLLVLSKIFSLYLKYFSSSFSAYQALGAFIILMFWLYFLGFLLLFGAVVNATTQEISEAKQKDR